MEEGSVDLTVTSPPYDNLRTYEGSLEWNEGIWKQVLEQLYRVTKKGGVVVWVVGDATIKGSETGTSFKQALYAKECGFNLHDTMIWCKDNPVPTQSTRYQNAFEYMFIFSKGSPNTFGKLQAPSKCAGMKNKKHRASGGLGHKYNEEGTYEVKPTKLRSNWWVKSCGSPVKGHGAVFPLQLARDHVISWSNEGDTVLDPFMGSGTTGLAAKELSRNFIGIEKVDKYFQIASDRIHSHNTNVRRGVAVACSAML
jgi:DNA modification methylase